MESYLSQLMNLFFYELEKWEYKNENQKVVTY